MAEDWAADVRKYAPDADDGVIAAVVRHCGIALQNRESSQVSFADLAETRHVRDGYCRKKLGLTDSDPVVDAAIARIGERINGDRVRNRVTVYYLLAEAFGKLGVFGVSATARAAVVEPAMPVPPAMAAASAAPATAPARPMPLTAAAARAGGRGPEGTTMFLGCGALVAIILGAAGLSTLVATRAERVPVASDAILVPSVPAAVTVTPAAAPAAIPAGAGVTVQDVAGKPAVSVYFDTAKTDIAADFAAVAAPVKAWIDGHPGARLAVSGFNDSRGNAAFNAELSKNRAKSVAAALAALGVPAAAIDLEKPAATTDTGSNPAQARRVDVTVKDAT